MKRLNVVVEDETHTRLVEWQKQHGYPNLDKAVDAALLRGVRPR